MGKYSRSGRTSTTFRRTRRGPTVAKLFHGRVRMRKPFRRGYNRTAGFYGRFAQGGELKFHDVVIDQSAISATGDIAIDSAVKIAQGTTEKTRIGRKATIRSINWRFEVNRPTGTDLGTGDEFVRVILYLDKQCNGATAAVTDILESANYQSFNNLANKSRFRTLMDRGYDINVESSSGNGTANDLSARLISDTFFKKCNIPIEWDNTAGAITEIKSNNIAVLVISKDGANTNCALESNMRIRFSDN